MKTNAAQKKLDKLVERTYYANCSGIQIDIMDISKVFAVGRAAILRNGLEQAQCGNVPIDKVWQAAAVKSAVVEFVNSIRKN